MMRHSIEVKLISSAVVKSEVMVAAVETARVCGIKCEGGVDLVSFYSPLSLTCTSRQKDKIDEQTVFWGEEGCGKRWRGGRVAVLKLVFPSSNFCSSAGGHVLHNIRTYIILIFLQIVGIQHVQAGVIWYILTAFVCEPQTKMSTSLRIGWLVCDAIYLITPVSIDYQIFFHQPMVIGHGATPRIEIFTFYIRRLIQQ